MALNKETVAVLGSASKQIGTYKESTGGGDPVEKGEKFKVADTPEEAEKMREADPDTKVRVNQPRNPDGTFGYNSQNARGLKYGPSRGTTVPHFLRGVDLLFLEKGTRMVMDGPDGIKVYISKIEMTKEQLIENCKHYIKSTKGFAGLHEGMMDAKRGRRSKDEKERVEQIRTYNDKFDKVENLKKQYGRDSEQYKEAYANLQKEYGVKDINDSELREGRIPSGILVSTRQYAVKEGTPEYDKIEKGLSGIDAGELGRNTWGVRNYNKAGVSEEQLADRADWRETKAEQVKANEERKARAAAAAAASKRETAESDRTTSPAQRETVPATTSQNSNSELESRMSRSTSREIDKILESLGV